MRYNRKTWWALDPGLNGDSVFSAADLPPEGILNGFGGENHINFANQTVGTAALYGLHGYILPIQAPETATTYQLIWDKMVDKASDAALTSLFPTTASATTTPIFEPGEARWEDLANMEVVEDDFELLNNRRMLSFANSPVGYDHASSAFKPVEFLRIRSDGKRRRVKTFSTAVFAVSLPTIDDVSTTLPVPTSNARHWMWTKYIKDLLKTAFDLMMTASPASSPWDLAATFLEELLVPPVFESKVGAFIAGQPSILGKLTYDISVPGEMQFGTISGG